MDRRLILTQPDPTLSHGPSGGRIPAPTRSGWADQRTAFLARRRAILAAAPAVRAQARTLHALRAEVTRG